MTIVQESNILILMSDSRKLDCDIADAKYYHLSAFINYQYAKRYGYDFLYYQPEIADKKVNKILANCGAACYSARVMELRSAHWTKILSSLLALNKSGCNYLVYLDTDCIFFNHERNIDSLVKQLEISGKSVLFFNDKPWDLNRPSSGFFIVKNDNAGNIFLTKWWSQSVSSGLKHPFEQRALYGSWCLEDVLLVDEWQFKLQASNQLLLHISHWEGNNRYTVFDDYIREKLETVFQFTQLKDILKVVCIYDPLKLVADFEKFTSSHINLLIRWSLVRHKTRNSALTVYRNLRTISKKYKNLYS